jgi:hypothetical protein
MSDYKTNGSFNLGNQITLKNVNSNVDRDYGPYEGKSLSEIAELLKDTIQIGKTVGVIENGTISEYWWQKVGDGFEFVPKQVSGQPNIEDIPESSIQDLFK